MSNRIRIEAVATEDLPQFARSYAEQAHSQVISPITSARAEAQAKNPLASPGDVGLLVAYSGEKCVGHLGVIPGVLRTGQEQIPMIWTYGLFVQPEYRTSTAVLQLMKRLILMKKDTVITGFNEPSRRLCTAFGFRDFGRLEFLKLDLRNLDLVSALTRKFGRLTAKITGRKPRSEFSQSLLYVPIRRTVLGRLSCRASSQLSTVTSQEVERVRPPVYVELPSPTAVCRDVETVNWMLDNPWIPEAKAPTHPPYAFSDVRNLSRFIAVELENERGECTGYVTLLVTEKRGRRTLKMLDVRVLDPSQYEAVLWLAILHAKRFDVEQLVLPMEMEQAVGGIRVLARTVSQGQRSYQWLSNSEDSRMSRAIDASGPPSFSYVDGDCAYG
ncbi:hypothetical protein CA54_40600 [Symmachiella macrocystis]|uniref:N-acetyltransferase domain-containing protein n=1 Tax=Symmachiella macrocystis TaxID=2527985 RepID=A0A5C6B9Q9_9PLAN|nr:GNAT family N-acetyltransferase [Symmachiella macrocystis]TWU08823.1 hypothetical protein CA54_40600 [Symmachiella macrocystis]